MREFKSNHIITKKILPVLLSPFLVISEAKAADSIAFPFDPILVGEIKKVVLVLKNSNVITDAMRKEVDVLIRSLRLYRSTGEIVT